MDVKPVLRVQALVRGNQLRHLVDRDVAQRYLNLDRLVDARRTRHGCKRDGHEREDTH